MNELDRRKYHRHAWRIPCSFRSPEGEQVGFITNVSARGFFVQARCKIQPGEELIITISDDCDPPMIITGFVARARRSHRSMTPLEQPGFGFRIDTAPEAFYHLVLELEEKE